MSESARTKFIAAGEKLYPELGYSKLSVRLLAAEAELSSGMFHHLFENKDVFMLEMCRHYNITAFGRLDFADVPDEPFARLYYAAFAIAQSVRDNLLFIQRIFTDSADNIAIANEFLKSEMEERTRVIVGLLEECAAIDDGVPTATIQRLGYLSSAVIAPMVLGTRFNSMGLLSDELSRNVGALLTDEAISQRLEWAVCAMFPSRLECVGIRPDRKKQ